MDIALKKAIKWAGGTVKLATALGISSQAISNWRVIPMQRVKQVSDVTGMPINELHPDLRSGKQRDIYAVD